MKKEMRPIIIPSTGRVKEHGGKEARSSLGPGSRFIFEGEWKNPEQDSRKALITVKDLRNYRIRGNIPFLIFILPRSHRYP